MENYNTNKYNFKILSAVAKFLNSNFENTVTKDVLSIMESGVLDEYAVQLLIGEGGGLDTYGEDRIDFLNYFPLCVKKRNPLPFTQNPYYKNVSFKSRKHGNAELCYLNYKKYEPFVYDDLTEHLDGVVLPQIGFFDEEFYYPAVKENGRIWMTVTPNEINTMKEPIEKANGKVLALGLGLGYFAYSCIIKSEVSSVTVIEKNPDIIALFKEQIYPFFPKDKQLNIIEADAIEYLKKPTERDFDLVFCDLWHDVLDGIPLKNKIKPFEDNFKKAKFYYWIDKSMKYYE
ncbi:MAG: hypothetical protein E7360_04915 [Clostridiales bacterium]|nr:hypothetical protein [Clostridiales bacterium]